MWNYVNMLAATAIKITTGYYKIPFEREQCEILCKTTRPKHRLCKNRERTTIKIRGIVWCLRKCKELFGERWTKDVKIESVCVRVCLRACEPHTRPRHTRRSNSLFNFNALHFIASRHIALKESKQCILIKQFVFLHSSFSFCSSLRASMLKINKIHVMSNTTNKRNSTKNKTRTFALFVSVTLFFFVHKYFVCLVFYFVHIFLT